MPDFDRSVFGRVGAGRLRLRRVLLVAGLLAFAVGGVAVAASSRPTLAAARNAKLGKTIVVDAKGVTVYVLAPETSKHLLCTSAMCLQFWPPVTVSSTKVKLKAGAGVSGRLGLLRRKGVLQVTLNGLPLYRFLLDHGVKGNAVGQGIKSFGGTWHVITAKTTKSTTKRPANGPATANMQTTPTATTAPAYPMPGY